MLKKERIKLTSKDTIIKIQLSNSNDFTGYQQEIDKLTNFNTLDIVNPVEDEEIRRFKYMFVNTHQISFGFEDVNPNTHEPSLKKIGFNDNEINTNNRAIQNSFYVVDFYDTFDKFSQTKIFSNYSSKIIPIDTDINNNTLDLDTTIYKLNNNSQFFYINVPIWFIESIMSGGLNTTVLYARFLFYNAKTGKITSFYNSENDSLTTDERYYVRTEFNLVDYTWKFLGQNIDDFNTVHLFEIDRNRNQNFNEKVNNTVNNINEERLNPPTGNIFDDVTGRYRIT
jgi:hypothetical protein